MYDPAKKVPMSSVKVAVNKVPYTGKLITEGVTKSFKINKVKLSEDMLGKATKSIMVKYTKKGGQARRDAL